MAALYLRRHRPNVADRDVLAHPVAESRSPADVPVAARAARRAAGKRSARVSGGARSPQLHPFAVQDELGAEIEADGASVRFKGRNTTVVSVPIGVDYDRIQGVVTAAGFDDEQQRLRRDVRADAGEHRRRGRRSARLHEGNPRAARSDRSRADAAARAARTLHVRADRRAVAIRARKLRRDRIRDRSQSRRGECEARGRRRRDADLLSQGRAAAGRSRRACTAWRISASSARLPTA